MNSGSFFRLDLDSSKVVDGITIFDYIDFPDLSAGDEGLRYPIRLTITQDAVSIFVHYYQEDGIPRHTEEVILHLPFNTNDTERLASSIKHIYNTEFPLSDHIHDCLINRYLDDNDKNDYKEYQDCQIIKDSYSSLAIWGLVEEVEGKPSYKLLDERPKQSETDSERITKFLRKLLLDFMFDMMHSDVFECSKYYAKMKEGLMNDFFFSSIVKKSEYYYNRHLVRSRFAVIKDNNHYIIISSGNKRERILSKEKRKKERLKKWIDGIDHAIEKCEKKLPPPSRRNPICPSIREILYSGLNKKKEKLGNKLKTIDEKINNHERTNILWESTLSSIRHLYAEKLDQSEKEWVETIMSQLADKHFTFTREWFDILKDGKRKEVGNSSSLEKNIDKWKDGIKKLKGWLSEQKKWFYKLIKYKKNRISFGISETWFVNPEVEMARVVFPLKRDGKENDESKDNYVNSYELGKLIAPKSRAIVSARNTEISKWFYRRYDFIDAFRIHFFFGWNFLLMASVVTFIVLAVLPTSFWEPPVSPSFLGNPVNIPSLLLILSILNVAISIGIGILGLINGKKQKKHNDHCLDFLLVSKRRRREGWRALRLSIFFFCFAAFFYFYKSTDLLCAFGKIAVMIIITLVLAIIENPSQHFKINNIHLFLPKLVASITAAWLMLVIGNNIDEEHISIPLCMIICFIVFAFILYENSRTIKNTPIFVSIFRAAELMLISFAFSLIIGVFALDILSPSLCKCSEECTPSHPHWDFLQNIPKLTLKIFPGLLRKFSVLAMFIGVFIQMIFEEKKMTEM